MRRSRRILAGIAGIALLPMLVAYVAAALAAVLHCEVSDLGPAQCPVLGMDIGGGLHAALTAGWISLITIPALALIVAVWLMFEAFIWRRRRLKARRALHRNNA